MSSESQSGSRLQMIEKDLFSSARKRTLIYSLLLVVLVLAVYNPVIHNGFINLDDNLYVTDNPHIKAGLHWATVKWSFVTFEQANWHPLTWLSHALDWQLFKKNAEGHHYTSLLFHAIDAVLLFLLLQKATGYTWRSLMVAALFAVHPVNVESVAWVAERKNVLSMLFFLLAMLAYGWYARRPSAGRYLLVPVLFAVGLTAKPQIITLPFVLLLWDYWPLQRFGSNPENTATQQFARASIGRLVLEKVPLLLLAGGDAVVTMYAQRKGEAVRSLGDYSVYARLGNSIISYARYVGHAFWPFHLSPIYSHHGDSIPAWQILSAMFFLLCVTAAVVVARKRYLLVGWLWFLGTLVPMIGIVQVGDQAMANRYAYIPFIGLFWIAVWLVAEEAQRLSIPSKWLAVPACLVVTPCCFLTHQLLGYWHDSEQLWNYAIRIDDQDGMAHANLGRILVAENRHDEAIAQFIIAERLHRYPLDDILAFVSYEMRKGYTDDAKERCQYVLSMTQDPHLRATAFTDLGVAALRQGDVEHAKPYFDAAMQADSKASGALVGLGLVAQRNGAIPSAIDYFSRAVKAEPNDLSYYLLAIAYEQAGREAEARASYAKAQELSRDINDIVQWAHQLLSDSQQPASKSSKLNLVSRH